jgi:hypothetical protein
VDRAKICQLLRERERYRRVRTPLARAVGFSSLSCSAGLILSAQSMPLKEVTAKTAAEASALVLRTTKAIQQEPVVVLENGRSRSRCIWIKTDKPTHLMLRSSTFPRPAISKFKNIYEQIEDEFVRSILLGGLWDFALFFRHTDDDTRRQRYIEKEIDITMWFGPVCQLGCCKHLLYDHMLRVPAEWREQVEELVVALKVLTADKPR